MNVLSMRSVWKVLAALVMLFLLWQAWLFVHPKPRPYAMAERNAVKALAERVAGAIESHAALPARIGVTRLVNDSGDQFYSALRLTLATRAGWTLEEGSLVKKLLADLWLAVARATNLDDVLKLDPAPPLDMILAGRVTGTERIGDGARAAMEVYAYDFRTHAWAVKEIVTAEWKPNPMQKIGQRLRAARPAARFGFWLAVVLALPWVTMFATHWALAKKSNRISVVLVGAYTVAGMALALALTGFSVAGAAAWLRFLAAFVISAAYNFWACERIAARVSA